MGRPSNSGIGRILTLQARVAKMQRLRERVEGEKAAMVFKAEDVLFEKQVEILERVRKNRFNGVCCTRRAGKTNLIVAMLFDYALRTGGDVVYVGLTTEAAAETVWEPTKGIGIERLALDLGGRLNKSKHTVTLPNGAHIYVRGVLDDRVKERFRGKSYALVALDECQSIRPDILGPFVEAVLEPTVADNGGTIVLSGTPAEFCNGLFWDVVGAQTVEKYATHWWSWEDNPHVRDKVRDEAESRRSQYGDGDALYLREYCGKWVPDANSLCWPNFSDANEYTPDMLPPRERLWYSCQGIDIGGGGDGDPAAVVTWSIYRGNPRVWLTAEKELSDDAGKLTDTDILAEVDRQAREWGPVAAACVDSVIKFGPAPGRDYPIEPADKREKAQQIRRMDDDMKRDGGIIMVPKGGPTATQFRTVFWDKKALAKGKKVPTSAVKNDLTDAGQYGYIKIVNLQSVPPPPLTVQERMVAEARTRMDPKRQPRDWKGSLRNLV